MKHRRFKAGGPGFVPANHFEYSQLGLGAVQFYKGEMTLRELVNFVRIVELQSISKAASLVRIAQPALSRQVRNLEKELGTELLVRHGWGVTPTEAGIVLFERARRITADFKGIRDEIAAISSEPTGTVSFGLPPTIAGALLPTLACRLRERWPRINVRYFDAFDPSLRSQLLTGELDIAILYHDRMASNLASKPLLTEQILLVGPPTKPKTLSEVLERETLIISARPGRIRTMFEQLLMPLPNESSRIIEVDSFPAIIKMVRLGMGYTFLPYSAIAEEVEAGLMNAMPTELPNLRRRLMLGCAEGKSHISAVVAVEREIHACIAQLSSKVRWEIA